MGAPTRPAYLSQHLVSCPLCGRPAAVHLDENHPGQPVLVRFVCSAGCRADDQAVLACIPHLP